MEFVNNRYNRGDTLAQFKEATLIESRRSHPDNPQMPGYIILARIPTSKKYITGVMATSGELCWPRYFSTLKEAFKSFQRRK